MPVAITHGFGHATWPPGSHLAKHGAPADPHLGARAQARPVINPMAHNAPGVQSLCRHRMRVHRPPWGDRWWSRAPLPPPPQHNPAVWASSPKRRRVRYETKASAPITRSTADAQPAPSWLPGWSTAWHGSRQGPSASCTLS